MPFGIIRQKIYFRGGIKKFSFNRKLGGSQNIFNKNNSRES